ncbi:hypothetical protein Tco_0368853 [Tanacetum coccineum]
MDLSVPLTEYEKLLGRSLFSTQEEKEEEVFNDDERTILFRMNILSLAPRLEIDIQVPGILEDKTKEIENKIDAQYVHEMLSIQMQNDVEKMQMEDVELRSVFGRHLLMYQNSNAEKILTVTKKATNLKMKWKTKEEKIDCGLYMIMHMELYEGSTAAQWKTGLLPENDKNHRMQMDNLRSRIAAKILLHEVNIYQKKMSDYAKKMTEAGEGGSNRQ